MNEQLPVAVDHNHLRTMASVTVYIDPIDWPSPLPFTELYRHLHGANARYLQITSVLRVMRTRFTEVQNQQALAMLPSETLVRFAKLLLLLLKKGSNAGLGESDIHPISPKTPAPQYQPIDRKKRKGKRVETIVGIEQLRQIKKHWPCS